MCRPKTKRGTRRAARLIAGSIAAIGLGAWLAGCSDIYWDRRESVALDSGDAVAANSITQVVDPWPANSGNKNIAFDGQKMQAAVERYRTGKVIQPTDPDNLQSTNQSGQTINQTTVNAGGGAAGGGAPPAASTTAQ
jgi:hypothetical protein